MGELTKDEYISNHDYMSYSRFCKYLRCEAAAVAGYKEPSSVAQLIGSYIDAYFSNELEEFKENNLDIFNSRTGQLKSDFIKANDIIARAENDELFMHYLSGEKQKIMVGTIQGVPFKIKMDSYKEDEFIVDLKVMKDFNKIWSDTFRRYANFIEAYDYDIELAIFQEIVYQNTGKKLPCYIAAITKEEPSDIGIFELPQKKLDEALDTVINNLPNIKKIMDGELEPHRCEKCSYCRQTKKAKILNWEYAGFSGDQLREEGIECNDELHKKEGK